MGAQELGRVTASEGIIVVEAGISVLTLTPIDALRLSDMLMPIAVKKITSDVAARLEGG